MRARAELVTDARPRGMLTGFVSAAELHRQRLALSQAGDEATEHRSSKQTHKAKRYMY